MTVLFFGMTWTKRPGPGECVRMLVTAKDKWEQRGRHWTPEQAAFTAA